MGYGVRRHGNDTDGIKRQSSGQLITIMEAKQNANFGV